MKRPKHLKQGNTIALISTARKITKTELQPALETLKSWGLNVVLGKSIDAEENQFAGSDKLRAGDLQTMLNDDSVNAILCARGGYGTVRIIDYIDFSHFIKHPKWICGFSDVTVLHSHIHTHCDIQTIHCAMPINFPKNGIENNATSTLKKALFGEPIIYEFESDKNRNGMTKAPIVGGNLSLLYALNNTPSDINTDGKILFIEDLDEYLYHIDRMMLNLKRSGKLKNLAGLVVGGFTEMKDNAIPFGKTAEEIIFEAVKEYNYPVCFNFPAGHIDDNRALILGRDAELKVEGNSAIVKF